VAHWRAKGKGSGLAIDLRSVDVYEFADGKIVRGTMGYTDKDTALKTGGHGGIGRVRQPRPRGS
jgi:hypothetical protein